jgi:hypothetical protein
VFTYSQAIVTNLTQRKIKHEENSGESNSVRFDLEETGFVIKPAKVEIGSGYTVAVDHDEYDRPVVDVKIYGAVDMMRVQRELENVFPNVKIRHLNQSSSVSIVEKARRKSK